MRIRQLELRRVRLRLVTPFTSSIGTEDDRDVLLVKATTEASEGWGECVAMTEPAYSPEYTEGAAQIIRQHLGPRLLASGEVSAEEVAGVLSPVKGHPMAKCALEMAVLDAELRARDQSLGSYLGSASDRVPAGVAVGIAPSLPELLDQVSQYREQGYRRVKLKIRPGWDTEPVRAVRERFGPDLLLQVDANSAYDRSSAPRLGELDPFGLVLIEQPLAEDDLLGHAQLAKEISTPICLDESITSLGSTATAIAMGACSVVNIKAGRVGGYLEARRIHDLCATHQIPVWCGGMLETGLGRAANLALAALPNFALVGDLSASERYFARDVTPAFVLEDGYLAVPRGAGLGVDIDIDFLDSVTTSVEYLAPT
ncbi:MAG: o-succinylbenzoate synthase [Acidimicrobiales bacterium]